MEEEPDVELLETLQGQLENEYKIKDGAENLLRVFSEGQSNGVSSLSSQEGSGGREQLRKQVQAELQSANIKIEAIKQQMDTIMTSIDSKMASTSRERLDQTSSPASALGLLQYGQAVPLRSQSRVAFGRSSRAESDAFALNSQTISLMQSLQSLTPPNPDQEAAIPPRSFSIGTDSYTPQRNLTPMGPPLTPSMTRSAQRSRAAALASSKGHTRTPSHAAGLGDLPRRRIEVMSRIVDNLDKSTRLRYDLPVEQLIACAFPCLADQAGKEVRASAYRLLRHALIRPPWMLIRNCRQAGLDLYLTRTFLRDSRFDLEKEQALKLVRTIMDCGCSDKEGEGLISVAVIRALVAAADHSEEKLRHLYIETLTELAVNDTELLVVGGGLRTVLQTTTDGPYEMSPYIMSILLTLIDRPDSRRYFQPGFDMEMALSSLTEGKEDMDSLSNACKVASIMLRSWSGFFYMCLYDKRAIRSLVIALQVNSIEVQDRILDLFCDLLSFPKGKPDHRRSTSTIAMQRYALPSTHSGNNSVNLYDQYLSLLALTLIECGIVEAIVHILEHKSDLSRKVTLLMGHLTFIAAYHLPSEYGVRLHALPELFRAVFVRSERKATQNGHNMINQKKEMASAALSAIDQLDRENARDDLPLKQENRNRSESIVTRSRAISSTVDENAFRTLLVEANVLNSKDHTKWNIDSLISIFEAIPGHPKRLDEVIRLTKLARRVLAFYHPFSLQYDTIVNTPKSHRYTTLACTVLQALMCHSEGIRFLTDDRLLKEIRDSLETDLMTQQRTSDTLTIGYFEMLGTLTTTVEGQQLMHKSNLFSALLRYIEENGNSEMVHAILEHFDFTLEGHCRLLLAKILTGSRPATRRYATDKLAQMIKKTPFRWLLSLLVTQLYDSSTEVRQLTCDLLLDVCTSSTSILEMVVSMQPMLEETSQSLLLMFMSTTIGLRYLLQSDFVDREMDEWYHYRNQLYMINLEVLLMRAFDPNRFQDDTALQWNGTVPAHFYGELTKTTQGCAVLEQRGHFEEFAMFIRGHSTEEDDVDVIAKLRSVLWAVGNIGATKGGLPFLEGEDLVQMIVKMATSSLVYSIRGTCYYVLGLIATTEEGAELLQDYGWMTFASAEGLQANRCSIPPRDFLRVDPWTPLQPFANVTVYPPDTKIERSIMLAISSLGNAIVANKASRTLAKLKSNNRRVFIRKGMELFVRSMLIADHHNLRQPIRRYLWELFEIKLDQDCVHQVMIWKERLLSGRRIKQQRSFSTVLPSEVSRQRQGDELLLGTAGLGDGDGEDDSGGEDDEGEDDDEEEGLTDGEADSDYDLEEGDVDDTEENSGFSSMQKSTMHLKVSDANVNVEGKKKWNPSMGGIMTLSGPASMPRKKVIGGFSLAQSLVGI